MSYDDDYDGDGDNDYGGDDDLDTVPCRYCRRDILEDAERCPYCENYISREDAPRSGRSWGFIVVMALALLTALYWAFAH